ncbi:MAG: hypothetical protein RLZZ258_724 [Actinomycetota bacterium]|jgi:ABC-type multidrug transport system ATPase subunit/pSer/pThr/pTyr-binding forkhead associated (FHA) protein
MENTQATKTQLRVEYLGKTQLFNAGTPVKIGRTPNNDVVVDDKLVSRSHAVVDFDENTKNWSITDTNSANGLFINGVRINSAWLTEVTEIQLGGVDDAPVLKLTLAVPSTLATGSATSAVASASMVPDIIIGKSADATFILSDVLVSRTHARLIHTGTSLLLEDLGSTNGTFVNGQIIRSQLVSEGDIITIGNTDLTIRGGVLDYLRDTTEKTGGLYVNDLEFAIKSGKKLLRGVNVRLAPGNLTAVIGPSGAGKSTFLRAIAGVTRPTAGSVIFDGFKVHDNFDVVSSRIGLVPQDDVLHTTLQLEQALSYAARLRLRVDGGASERDAQVEKVIEKLELGKNRDTRIDKLSGGQRKRASVALELLTEPSLLILDEPTSGLDPAMDRQVMKTLRELADDDRGVLVVTHSVAHLDVCDDVLVLAPGGMPAYYGPPAGIIRYFGTTDWADIFAIIKDDPEAAYQRYLAQGPAPVQPPADLRAGSMDSRVRTAPWWEQFSTLCARQISLIFADKGYLAFLLMLPIIVGLLVLVVPGTNGLGPADNAFPLEQSQLLAMLVIGSSFMGASISIRDLTGERPIFLRERAVGLPVSAYLASKLLVFGIFSWFMAGVLTAVTLIAKPAPTQSVFFEWPVLELFLALGLTSMASMVLGLLLSAIVSSSEQVMPLLIVVLMAQLVLNGGLLPLTGRGFINDLSNVILAKWGFAMAASGVDLNALSPTLDEDPLWAHQLDIWLLAAAALVGYAVVLATLTRIRLEGKYIR